MEECHGESGEKEEKSTDEMKAKSTDEMKASFSQKHLHGSLIFMDDGKHPLSLQHAMLMLWVVLIPSAILMCGFSNVGYGMKVYDALSPKYMDYMGRGLVAFSCSVIAFFYIFGWSEWRPCLRYCSVLVPSSAMISGCILVAGKYPYAPLIMTMSLTPLAGIGLRLTICGYATRSTFYKWFFLWTLTCAVLMMSIWIIWIVREDTWYDGRTKSKMAKDMHNLWKAYRKLEDPWLGNKMRYLNYDTDCGPDKDIARFTSEAKTHLGTNCKKALNVIFTCWVSPLIGSFFNLVVGSFALMNGLVNNLKGDCNHADDLARLEAMLKRFLSLLVFVLMGIYFSCSISGASTQLGSTMLAFFSSSLAVLVIIMYVEIGPQNMRKHVKKSRLSQTLLKLWYSDWARALFVGAFNVFLPIFFLLNRCKRIVQKCQGVDPESNDKFTPVARKILDELKTWNWASILTKICLLGELFFTLQVGVAKATYIFLSWLNGQLSSWDYGIVIIVIFAIGYAMFLLPPVPGVPVYIFCGIVIAEQGRHLESVGFWLGCTIACAVAWALKLCACTGQYMIGYCAGQSLRIQALIGVDRVITRAIEQILRVPGLDLGKVAVLIGGPDWPVSVTCGILKISIPQMLLGTAPVVLISSPCVLAGAFLGRVVAGEDSLWSALATSFMGLMGLAQMGCAFMAFAHVAKVVENDGVELAKPREEHAAIAALTAKQAAQNKLYREITAWKNLACPRKFIICTAAACQLFSGFCFSMGGEYCFRPFSISSDIDAPFEDQGLNRKWYNIVRPPGAAALGLFALGTLLHIFFTEETSRLAKRKLTQIQQDPDYDKQPVKEDSRAWLTTETPVTSPTAADMAPAKPNCLESPASSQESEARSEP